MNRDADDESVPDASRRDLLATTGVVGVSLLAGCFEGRGVSGDDQTETADESMEGESDTEESMEGESDADESMDSAAWQSVELTTVRGDESFTIANLDGPVVVQSFAVWCPKCERQSNELANVDESVTVVGLDIDPNEDAAKVRQHANDNGFDWRFTVAPPEMTDSLVETFGTTVTNAPSTPLIVACDDGTTEFLSGEVASVAEIEDVADGC